MNCGGDPSRAGQCFRTRSMSPPIPPEAMTTACPRSSNSPIVVRELHAALSGRVRATCRARRRRCRCSRSTHRRGGETGSAIRMCICSTSVDYCSSGSPPRRWVDREQRHRRRRAQHVTRTLRARAQAWRARGPQSASSSCAGRPSSLPPAVSAATSTSSENTRPGGSDRLRN